jgi:DNA polymerase III delta prime subunit
MKTKPKFFTFGGGGVDDEQSHHDIIAEKYRPRNLDEFVGNDVIKKKMEKYLNSSQLPPHMLFHGPSGTGKSTLARMLVKHVDCDYIIINASDENNVDTVRTKVKGFASTIGFKSIKIIVLDEFEYMSKNAQAILRNMMEKFSENCRFILTCNHIDMVIKPIKSRCQIFNVEPPSKKDVGIHVARILKKEEITFDIRDLKSLIDTHYPDMRQILTDISRQLTDENELVLDAGSLLDNDFKLKILDILADSRSAKSRFTDIRQLIANNHITKFQDVYRTLFDNTDVFAKGAETTAILLIADYLYKDSLVVDSEINFMALIIELLNEIKE